MPTYPVINKKTEEKKELHMTMKEYDNPDWDKDWQESRWYDLWST